MEFYLNQVYFGSGAYGVQSAARIFFGKPVQNLDEILAGFESWFDFAVLPDDVQQSNNSPSTIIEFSDEKLNLIREGSIPFSEI